MKVTDLDPAFDCRVGFNEWGGQAVPPDAGCYILASADDAVLYIGQTNNLRRRISQHLNTRRMRQDTVGAGGARFFYYRLLPAKEVYEIEQLLLFKHRYREGQWPALNRCGP